MRSSILILVLGLLPPVIAPNDRGAVAGATSATEVELSAHTDEDDIDDADDGSHALDNSASRQFSSELTPLSLDEEQGLLGHWGDSAAESED